MNRTNIGFLNLPIEIRDNILQLLPNQADILSLMKCSRASFEAVYKFLWCEPEFCRYSSLKKFIGAITRPDCGSSGPFFKRKGRYVREINLSTLSKYDKKCLVKDSDIIAILAACPNLASLRIPSCEQLSSTLFHSVPLLSTNLQEIDFSNLKNLDETLLCNIVRANAQLERLELANCPSIRNSCLRELAQLCGPRLKTLDLLLCSNLDDDTLMYIAEAAPHLAQLNIGGCNLLTDAGLGYLVRHCPELEILILRGLTKMTNATLHQIVCFSRNIKVLDLSQTEKVTIAGVRQVLAHCMLEEIDFQYSFNLLTGLKQWLYNCNSLSIVNGRSIDEYLEFEELGLLPCPPSRRHQMGPANAPEPARPIPVAANTSHSSRALSLPHMPSISNTSAYAAACRTPTPYRRNSNFLGAQPYPPSGHLGTSPAASFISQAFPVTRGGSAFDAVNDNGSDSNCMDEDGSAPRRHQLFLEPDSKTVDCHTPSNGELKLHFSGSLKLFELSNPLSTVESDSDDSYWPLLSVRSPSNSRPASPLEPASKASRTLKTNSGSSKALATPTKKRTADKTMQSEARKVQALSLPPDDNQENVEFDFPAVNTRSKMHARKPGSLPTLRRYSLRTCGKRPASERQSRLLKTRN